MKRPLLILGAAIVLFFIVITFLNCGVEADAMTRKEQVRRNKVTATHLVVGQQLQAVTSQHSCYRAEGQFVFENYLGNRLFTYTLVGRWCGNGARVTWHRWAPSQYSIGNYWWSNWNYEGSQEPVDVGGNGMRYVFRRIKGTFGVHIFWFHRTVTPYVQCTLRGDGTSRCGDGL